MNKSVTITKLHPASWGKLVGTIQATFGFLGGFLVTLLAVSQVVKIEDTFIGALGISAAVAAFAVVILPIGMFIVGWLQGVLTALFLNLILTEMGGIGIDIKEDSTHKARKGAHVASL